MVKKKSVLMSAKHISLLDTVHIPFIILRWLSHSLFAQNQISAPQDIWSTCYFKEKYLNKNCYAGFLWY